MLLLLASSNLCVTNSNDSNLSVELTERKTFSLLFVITRSKEKKELFLFDSFKGLLFSEIGRGILFSHLRSRSL